MKYYIDFEFDHERSILLSIGCFSEDRRSFYRLINPHRSVSPWVLKMTKLSPSEIEHGCDISTALTDFKSYLNKDKDPVFYVKGNQDKLFLSNFITRFDVDMDIISFIANRLVDVDPIINKHFHCTQNVSQTRLLKYFGIPTKGSHNALTDAINLFEIMERVNATEDFSVNMFPTEMNGTTIIKRIDSATGELLKTYKDVASAGKDIIALTNSNINQVKGEIKAAIKYNKEYVGFRWEKEIIL